MNKIIKRIIEKSGVPNLQDVLVDRLSLPDLQSLLLEVYRNRVKKLKPVYLSEQFSKNRFVQPAQVDPETAIKFDLLAFSLLPDGYEKVELSPVCPLGTNSIVAPVDQNNTITTIRNVEVCSDPTNLLALECADRRKKLQSKEPRTQKKVKLAASQRVLRGQAFDEPGAFAHFRIFVLCTAGRDQGSFKFEVESIFEHLDFYIRLLLNSQGQGIELNDIRVFVTDLEDKNKAHLENQVLERLRTKHPEIQVQFDQERSSGRGYYSGACFQIFARDQKGTDFMLVDGGLTDWTQQFLSNRKERFLCSGIGSERLCACFKA